LHNLTPKEIVEKLDQYIIGQQDAKKAVAIALRNRYRRKQLAPELKEEIYPKNIIMIGSTGVGKTEIARRLAKMVKAPFLKIEASKFTEVGYVGRDVDSIIRDLTENSIRMVKQEKMEEVEERSLKRAEERILNFLAPLDREKTPKHPFEFFVNEASAASDMALDDDYKKDLKWREKIKEKLTSGELENIKIEIEVEEKSTPFANMFSGAGVEELGINMQDMFESMMPKNKKKRKITVEEARKILAYEEAQGLIDMDEVQREAVKRVEEDGIVFLDEIDKIVNNEGSCGADVSRGGVQRDILPIVEGATVNTKYGQVKTDHILFVAAGAFHYSKPSDLIPELQGRFPIRVELNSLTRKDLKRILTEPNSSLIKQYIALLSTEEVEIEFSNEAVDSIADIAYEVNNGTEDIGARRLHTVMEKLLEDLLFEAPYKKGERIIIDEDYVTQKLNKIVEDEDLSRYIL